MRGHPTAGQTEGGAGEGTTDRDTLEDGTEQGGELPPDPGRPSLPTGTGRNRALYAVFGPCSRGNIHRQQPKTQQEGRIFADFRQKESRATEENRGKWEKKPKDRAKIRRRRERTRRNPGRISAEVEPVLFCRTGRAGERSGRPGESCQRDRGTREPGRTRGNRPGCHRPGEGQARFLRNQRQKRTPGRLENAIQRPFFCRIAPA